MKISREPVAPEDVMIHVIVPFYNCMGWIDRCLRTLQDQTHPKFQVVVIDDASNDGSSWYAEGICKELGWAYYYNEKNMKCPYNLWYAIGKTGAAPGDVIFLLDGDDYLPHERVLSRFAEVYGEADVWMTYGQYMSDPPDYGCTPAVPPPYEAVMYRSYRKVNCFFNHPITFRKFLFDAIPVEEFKDNDGNWFQAGYDRTLIYPLMELATPYPWNKVNDNEADHWRFLNEINYVYNSENPNSDWRVMAKETLLVDQVHDRPPLNPLGK